jgi:hypothetical protein
VYEPGPGSPIGHNQRHRTRSPTGKNVSVPSQPGLSDARECRSEQRHRLDLRRQLKAEEARFRWQTDSEGSQLHQGESPEPCLRGRAGTWSGGRICSKRSWMLVGKASNGCFPSSYTEYVRAKKVGSPKQRQQRVVLEWVLSLARPMFHNLGRSGNAQCTRYRRPDYRICRHVDCRAVDPKITLRSAV